MSFAESYDVFLSHNAADKPAVESIARQLRDRGLRPWLDKWHLVPGEQWQPAIEDALACCKSCAVFIGPHGQGTWQLNEMRAAIDRRTNESEQSFRVIPVLLPGGQRESRSKLPTFLTATTWVEFSQSINNVNAMERLVCGIRGIAPDQSESSDLSGVCPYRGLQVFDVEHASHFFGREALSEWLCHAIDPSNTVSRQSRFLGVIGASGSGKSSLARAGLAASLSKGAVRGSDQWQIEICRPSSDPLESLAVSVGHAIGSRPLEVTELAETMKQSSATLHRVARTAMHEAPPERRLLILVDQFEETFTTCRDENQRQAFIENLIYPIDQQRSRVIVVITLRADFYGHCGRYSRLAAALSDNQLLVSPPSQSELIQAIERPAKLAGTELEPGLTQRILDDAMDQAGALPLVQHALLELWHRRDHGRLTHSAYDRIGGVVGALEKRAEDTFLSMNEEQQQVCRQVFLRLVEPGEGSEDTKRRALLSELLPVGLPNHDTAKSVIDALADSDVRLVTIDTDDDQHDAQAEVAHEALIRGWKRLREWISEDREGLRIHRRLSEAAWDWDENGRAHGYLYGGALLANAENWAASNASSLNALESSFLTSSLLQRDRIRAAERRTNRRLWVATCACALLMTLAASFGFLAHRSSEENRFHLEQREIQLAEQTRATSTARAKVLLAKLEGRTNSIVLLQLEIFEELSRENADVRLAFLEALLDSRDSIRRLNGRINYVVHATVGFDEKIREQAKALALQKLNSTTTPYCQLGCLAMLAHLEIQNVGLRKELADHGVQIMRCIQEQHDVDRFKYGEEQLACFTGGAVFVDEFCKGLSPEQQLEIARDLIAAHPREHSYDFFVDEMLEEQYRDLLARRIEGYPSKGTSDLVVGVLDSFRYSNDWDTVDPYISVLVNAISNAETKDATLAVQSVIEDAQTSDVVFEDERHFRVLGALSSNLPQGAADRLAEEILSRLRESQGARATSNMLLLAGVRCATSTQVAQQCCEAMHEYVLKDGSAINSSILLATSVFADLATENDRAELAKRVYSSLLQSQKQNEVISLLRAVEPYVSDFDEKLHGNILSHSLLISSKEDDVHRRKSLARELGRYAASLPPNLRTSFALSALSGISDLEEYTRPAAYQSEFYVALVARCSVAQSGISIHFAKNLPNSQRFKLGPDVAAALGLEIVESTDGEAEAVITELITTKYGLSDGRFSILETIADQLPEDRATNITLSIIDRQTENDGEFNLRKLVRRIEPLLEKLNAEVAHDLIQRCIANGDRDVYDEGYAEAFSVLASKLSHQQFEPALQYVATQIEAETAILEGLDYSKKLTEKERLVVRRRLNDSLAMIDQWVQHFDADLDPEFLSKIATTVVDSLDNIYSSDACSILARLSDHVSPQKLESLRDQVLTESWRRVDSLYQPKVQGSLLLVKKIDEANHSGFDIEVPHLAMLAFAVTLQKYGRDEYLTILEEFLRLADDSSKKSLLRSVACTNFLDYDIDNLEGKWMEYHNNRKYPRQIVLQSLDTFGRSRSTPADGADIDDLKIPSVSHGLDRIALSNNN